MRVGLLVAAVTCMLTRSGSAGIPSPGLQVVSYGERPNECTLSGSSIVSSSISSCNREADRARLELGDWPHKNGRCWSSGEPGRQAWPASGDSSLGSNELWWDGFWPSGTNGPVGHYSHETVNALALYHGELIAAGEFGFVDGVRVHGIAAWDGTRWVPFGSSGNPFGYSGPLCLTVYRDKLIAGGAAILRADSTCIAAWDGSTWVPLGRNLTSGAGFASIYHLIQHGDRLVASGHFTRVGGHPAPGVAEWDGVSWQAIGSDSLHGEHGGVRDIVAYSGELYAAGVLEFQEGDSAWYLTRWDGSAWRQVGSRPDGHVTSLAVYGNELVVGGEFTRIGGVAAHGLASWDGRDWRPFGGGVSGRRSSVGRLFSTGSHLYIEGSFDSTGGVAAPGFAVWDGSSWSAVGLPEDAAPAAYSMCEFGARLVVGGRFDIGGTRNLAVWDGSSWGPIQDRGIMLRHYPTAFLATNEALLVGGSFAESKDRNGRERLAAWDGFAWTPVGPPLDAQVNSLAIYDERLVAAGAFDSIAAEPVHFVAELDGDVWKPLGAGMSWPVSKLIVYQERLIAAGAFYRADGQTVNRIAQWNGERWSSLGGGVTGPGWPAVTGLQIFQGDLIVTGHFTKAGDIECEGIARWDGVRWSSMHEDFAFTEAEPWVYESSICNGQLVVDGEFRTVGGKEAHLFAIWDGAVWRPLEPFRDGVLSAHGSYDGRLVAGGWFSTGGNLPDSTYIFQYDGHSWFRMGAGVWSGTRGVYGWPALTAIAQWDGDLYLGGLFEVAGDKPSPFIARWDGSQFRGVPRPPKLSVEPNPVRGQASITWYQDQPGTPEIRVFDIAGRSAITLATTSYGIGTHTLALAPSHTGSLPSGAYVVRLKVNGTSTSRKMILLR